MSKSYDRNIERLRANQRSVSDQEQAITTSAAQARGQYEIDHATNIANKLTPFSTALQEWKDKNIKKQIEEGRQEREKARLENAKWMAEHGSKTQQRIIEMIEEIPEHCWWLKQYFRGTMFARKGRMYVRGTD